MINWLIKIVYAAGPGGGPTAPPGTTVIPNYGGTTGGNLTSDGSFKGIIEQIIIPGVLKPLIGLLLTAALVVFLWGVVKYVKTSSDEKERANGHQMMIYGLIALFVMVSVWGLVNVLVGTFNLPTGVPRPQTF